MSPPLLSITDLHVSVENKPILHGISLEIQEGEIHAVMGPNGSGKSTLANTLMGHPKYTVTKGNVLFQGKDLLAMKPDERARSGLFLAFQYPRELAGVTLRSFLFAAYNACHASPGLSMTPNVSSRVLRSDSAQAPTRDEGKKLSPIKFKKIIEEHMRELHMDPAFAERSVNQGFSGGEKKKAEILQLKVLKPTLALLDETDSGLDIDALKIVAEGVNSLRNEKRTTPAGRSLLSAEALAKADGEGWNNEQRFSAIIVTHYARILEYITPDKIHIMVGGKIVESGGASLARILEKEGYKKYGAQEASLPLSITLE